MDEEESQRPFHFGEKNSDVKMHVVLEGMRLFAPVEPWTLAMGNFDLKKISSVRDLSTITKDMCETIFKASGFQDAPRALALLILALDSPTWQEPPPAPASEGEDQAVKEAKNKKINIDNAQKTFKVARVDVFSDAVKSRLVCILCAMTSDLVLPTGGSVDFMTRAEIGHRLFLAGHHLLPDGSQRHNLDFDVRELIARFLTRFFHYAGGYEVYDTWLKSRWRNMRTGKYVATKALFASPAIMNTLHVAQLVAHGKVVPTKNASPNAKSVLADDFDLQAFVNTVRLSCELSCLLTWQSL
jgi:hypothetical protein